MSMKRCASGHFFDTGKHTQCPACGVAGLHIDETLATAAGSVRHDLDIPTRPREQPSRPGNPPGTGSSEPGVTVAQIKRTLGIHPVVGWLVCVEGPDKGRDYRIRSERNFIGRDPGMDICISGDEGISRERHAIISFNPRKCSYLLMPGESHGIIYHNDDDVIGPVELNPYDSIEMAQTKLLFIPFCGPQFMWTAPES